MSVESVEGEQHDAAPSDSPGALGDQLRLARESAGLSVEAVAAALRLKSEQVYALEQGHYTAVTHPAYLRGYIRNYCRLVGVCPTHVLSLLPSLSLPPPVKQERLFIDPAYRVALRARRWVGSSVMCVAVLLCCWHWGVRQGGQLSLTVRQKKSETWPISLLQAPVIPESTLRTLPIPSALSQSMTKQWEE